MLQCLTADTNLLPETPRTNNQSEHSQPPDKMATKPAQRLAHQAKPYVTSGLGEQKVYQASNVSRTSNIEPLTECISALFCSTSPGNSRGCGSASLVEATVEASGNVTWERARPRAGVAAGMAGCSAGTAAGSAGSPPMSCSPPCSLVSGAPNAPTSWLLDAVIAVYC
jgi:hypothetical protein